LGVYQQLGVDLAEQDIVAAALNVVKLRHKELQKLAVTFARAWVPELHDEHSGLQLRMLFGAEVFRVEVSSEPRPLGSRRQTRNSSNLLSVE
jgi:hypothetical protein